MPKKVAAGQLITHLDPKSPVAEAFRVLRTNLHYVNLDKKIKTVMVTSAGPNEGKSTILANLAVAIAQTGQKVLIVDADLRKPTQHKIFSLNGVKGLTNLLVEEVDFAEVVQPCEVENLSIITSGPIPPNPSELLGSLRMDSFLSSVTEYDLVLFDTPPVVAVTDAAVLSSKLDGVLLLIESKKVKIERAKAAKEQLLKANARILGVILNNVAYSGDDYQYYYYYGEKR